MIESIHNRTKKLSHSKPCNGAALCDSLVAPLQGFALLNKGQTITMKKIIYLGFLALFLVPSFSFASFDVSLKYGSKGQAVSDLQDFLADQNVYTGKVDGRFGLGTLKAVKAFQLANKLSADGYFGRGSRTVANTLLAAEIQSSDVAEQQETGSVSAPVVQPQATQDTGTQSAITSLSQQVSSLSQQLQDQNKLQQQIVNNTTPVAVQAPVVPVSQKAINVQLIPADQYNQLPLNGIPVTQLDEGKCGFFNISVLDDSGSLIKAAYPVIMTAPETPNNLVYFMGAPNGVSTSYYCPQGTGSKTVNFSYKDTTGSFTTTVNPKQ